MKKILNYFIAMALTLVGSISAVNAASITVENSVVGQDYNAYKIFDVTKSGENYAYSIDSTNEWFSVVQAYATEKSTITLTRVGTTNKYIVQVKNFDAAAAADFAAELNKNKEGKTVTKTVRAKEGETTVIDGLAAGYYFVDSSLGALCALHTTTSTQTVEEKNSTPTVEKQVSQTSASVGDEVTFTIKIKAGGKADTSYILHDTMTEGLTLDNTSFEIKVGETAVAASNYTIITEQEKLTDGCTFEIIFNEAYTASLNKDTEIVVTYTATLNEKAIINSVDSNVAKLKYGNSYAPTATVKVYNYDFDLIKINTNKEQLSGAKFKLYDAKTGGKEILLKLVTENGETFYRPIQEGETADEYIIAGSVRIKGLEGTNNKTYYLEEKEAPAGYNQLTERVEIILNSDLVLENAVKVENTTSALLPSTGGMGTLLFVTIGSIMVLGFGVLLVTKLRISKMYI